MAAAPVEESHGQRIQQGFTVHKVRKYPGSLGWLSTPHRPEERRCLARSPALTVK